MPKINDLKHYPEKDNQPITRPWSRRALLILFGATSTGILGISSPDLSALAQTMGMPGGPPSQEGPGDNSAAITEAFKEITTDGTAISDLFPVYRTGSRPFCVNIC